MLKRKYPKWCPKCKALHQAIWRECTVCRVPLISSWWVFPWRVLKFFRFLLTIAAALGLFVALTYLTQKSELKFYKHSYHYLKAGQYHEAWAEFEKAFWYNPVSRLVRSCADGISKIASTSPSPSGGNAAFRGQKVPQPPSVKSATLDQSGQTTGFTGVVLGVLFLILIGIAVIIGMLLNPRKTAGISDQYEELKVYCETCHGLHKEGRVFCPEKWTAAKAEGSGYSLSNVSSMYEFRYKWRTGDRELTGSLQCKDEESLQQHLKIHGGELIAILEKTKVVLR